MVSLQFKGREHRSDYNQWFGISDYLPVLVVVHLRQDEGWTPLALFSLTLDHHSLDHFLFHSSHFDRNDRFAWNLSFHCSLCHFSGQHFGRFEDKEQIGGKYGSNCCVCSQWINLDGILFVSKGRVCAHSKPRSAHFCCRSNEPVPMDHRENRGYALVYKSVIEKLQC